ncbi:MAG: aminopeptidase P family protein [Clostridia bacterium]|nr:aminopeptidase P family protein [Clostridia bacterium]
MKETVFEITKRRTDSLRAYAAEKNIDAVFVSSGPGVRYLSGFAGTPGDASLLITADNAYIFTDSRYTIQACEQCPYYELRSAGASDFSKVKEALPSGTPVVGFENLEISYNHFTRMKDTFGFDNFAGIGTAIADLRNIKDDSELEYIKKACEIACASIADTVPYIKDGVLETDLATELEYRMKKHGASGPSFDTIVASGVRGALPHGLASSKAVRSGEMITFDFGSLYNGYCSDMTRTFALGDPDPEMVKIYNTVLYAQMTAIDAYRPGMPGSDLDKVARSIIEEAGYGKYFGHGLGHGVGLEIHEGVGAGPRSGSMLVERTVFSVEPGIYIENFGGVRIEDLITCVDGVKTVLTASSPKGLMIL